MCGENTECIGYLLKTIAIEEAYTDSDTIVPNLTFKRGII